MILVHSPRYQVDIGAHVFHMGKYALVREALLARALATPAVVVLAGGYARRAEDTAAIHVATIEEAIRLGA